MGRAIFQILQRPRRGYGGKRVAGVTITGVAHCPKSKDNITRWANVRPLGHVTYYSKQGPWQMGYS